MEEISTAAAPDANVAPVATEATSTNTAQAAPEVEPAAPAAPTANIPADQIEAFNRFIDANGGYDKAFSKLKTAVSTPAPQPEPAAQPQYQQEPQQQYQQQYQPQQQQRIEGGITANEFLAMQYFDHLSHDEKYAGIADQIRTGDVLKEMADFGINPLVNGQINDRQVRRYLDLKAQTVPAQPTGTPAATATPTVDYVKVGETINSVADAQAVLQQSMQLRASGQAEHPQYQSALEFLQKQYGLTK